MVKKTTVSSYTNERSEAMNKLCTSFKEMNKKQDVENLKYFLLKEDLEAKQKLHELQLQAAAKDLIRKKQCWYKLKELIYYKFTYFNTTRGGQKVRGMKRKGREIKTKFIFPFRYILP